MSTDVYIDTNNRPFNCSPEDQWFPDCDTISIGYLYTFISFAVNNETLLDFLRLLGVRYPIFNNLALSELRGFLREFDLMMAQENKMTDEELQHRHGLSRDYLNDYLNEEMAIKIFPGLLGKYWYLRVD